MNLKKNTKYFLIWVLICFGLMSTHYLYHGFFSVERTRLTVSQFVEKVKDRQFIKVELKNREAEMEGINAQGQHFFSPRGSYPIVHLLDESGIPFDIVPPNAVVELLLTLFWVSLPVGLFFVAWIVFSRMQGNNRLFGLTKSKSKAVDLQKTKTTFADVEGMAEVKEEVKDIVDFLKNPERFHAIGGRLPRGILLEGPPGTGKTLLARAIAGEAHVSFFSVSGSDFVEVFAGMGASRVRSLFQQARENAPCVIFIDEIDAVGRARSSARTVHEEREQTLNQLLVEMDGFDVKEGVIVVAATNRAEVLDEALLRPGRFDRIVSISLPNLKEREQIITLHLKKVQTEENVSAKELARGTPGFSGADLANLVNQGALFAARKHKKAISQQDLEACRDKSMLGHERKSLSLLEEERKVIAYHEAGHAIVSFFCVSSEPIHKATIMPRGQALGMVVSLPENDRVLRKRQFYLDEMCVLMAGRVSEELIFGTDHVTTGASNDFRQATRMAKLMVQEWGMSELVGPIHVYHSQGWDGSSLSVYSQDTLQLIDREVNLLLRKAYERARALLSENMDKLEALAQNLLIHETLTGDEVREIIRTGALENESQASQEANKEKRALESAQSIAENTQVLEKDHAVGQEEGGQTHDTQKNKDQEKEQQKEQQKEQEKGFGQSIPSVENSPVEGIENTTIEANENAQEKKIAQDIVEQGPDTKNPEEKQPNEEIEPSLENLDFKKDIENIKNIDHEQKKEMPANK